MKRALLGGSAARGQMGPDSDIDLLLVKGGEFDRGKLPGDIYVGLHGVGQAVDVVLVTPEQVNKNRETPWLIIRQALREGQRFTIGPGSNSEHKPPRCQQTVFLCRDE
jgi:predicted nucleotidyltransferase